MKRKKQLLSWILSFLMVFSIMPMMSISAFAATYDADNLDDEWALNQDSTYLEVGDIIELNGCKIDIYYYKDQSAYTDGIKAKKATIEDPSYGGVTQTVLSAEEAELGEHNGYVLDKYLVEYIFTSSGDYTEIKLIANWKKVHKITDDMTNITVSKIDVDGEKYDIDGQTSVTTGSAAAVTLVADTGYTLPDTVTVEMGGNVLESPAYEYDQASGKVVIHNITGEVKITAVGVEQEEPPAPPTPPNEDPNNTTTGPAISIGQTISIGRTSATIRSSITPGKETIISQGFEWKRTDGGTYVQESGTLNNGILTTTLTGLSKNTMYTVRAFVVTETKTYYGDESTFKTKKSTRSGSSSSSSSSSSSGSGSDSKSDILIVEPTEEAIIKALKTSDYKKIQVNIDSNPNLLLSKAIIDALAENKDKTLIVVSNSISTNVSINENNEMKFTRNGIVLTGFISVFNSEYYSDYNGIVQKGWVEFPGSNWYYLDRGTGIKGRGWIEDNGSWYYLNQIGLMQTGWINDNGAWYYLDKSGKMLANTTIDGYVLGSSGAWIA